MALTKVHTVVAVIGLVVASALAWWWQHRAVPAQANDARTDTTAGSARTQGGGVAPPPAGPRDAGAALPANAGARAAAPGPAAVEVGKVEVMPLEDAESAVGSLRSRQGVMIRPEVSGRIARLNFKNGQTVRRGQLLVQLDDTLQRAQLRQAQAQSAIARTNLARNRELLAENFVSRSAVDQSAAALEVAQSQVALAQAQLARMRIVAPFDGVTGIGLVDLGDYLKDGADIVNLEDQGSVWVDFRLPERVMSKVRVGLAVDVTLDALPGRSFKGKVEAADAQLDTNGRSLLVRARLDNPRGELRAGMFARVRTVFAVRSTALVVPEEALVPQGNRQFLLKVVGGADGSPVTQRLEARLGLRVPGKVEVLEGLAPGDLVVTAGQGRLMRGDALPVRVVEVGRGPGMATGAPARPPDAASAAPAAQAPRMAGSASL